MRLTQVSLILESRQVRYSALTEQIIAPLSRRKYQMIIVKCDALLSRLYINNKVAPLWLFLNYISSSWILLLARNALQCVFNFIYDDDRV